MEAFLIAVGVYVVGEIILRLLGLSSKKLFLMIFKKKNKYLANAIEEMKRNKTKTIVRSKAINDFYASLLKSGRIKGDYDFSSKYFKTEDIDIYLNNDNKLSPQQRQDIKEYLDKLRDNLSARNDDRLERIHKGCYDIRESHADQDLESRLPKYQDLFDNSDSTVEDIDKVLNIIEGKA